MNLNLIMAVVWLVVGAAWLAANWARPGSLPVIRLGGLEFSPAWLAFLLVLYNLARWRLSPRRRRQPTLEEALEARRRMHRAEEHPKPPPDPTFKFTDAPPPPTDAPPSEPPPPGV
jgi:hypothetical protein